MYRKAVLYNPTIFSNDSQITVTSKHFLSKGTNKLNLHTLIPFTKLNILKVDLLTEIDSGLAGSLNIVTSGP